jgi:hypothetical protein
LQPQCYLELHLALYQVPVSYEKGVPVVPDPMSRTEFLSFSMGAGPVGCVPSKRVISSLTYNFVTILKKNLGAPARLSSTVVDFAQKQSDHDIFFSFKVSSYKIGLVLSIFLRSRVRSL